MKTDIRISRNAKAARAPHADRPVLVDFDNLYHTIKKDWGDRKINVASLVRFMEDSYPKNYLSWCGFIKATGAANVEKFDKILDGFGFSRVYVFDAPPNLTCSPLMAKWIVEIEVHQTNLVIVSSDPGLKAAFPKADFFGFGAGKFLPLSLLTPIPVQSYFGVYDGIELD